MATKLLDLSTIDPERPVIAIDGKEYDMQLPDDFGLSKLAQLQRLQRKAADIVGRVDALSDSDVQGMADALDGFVLMVLPSVPPEVRAKLRDAQKMNIIAAFRAAAAEKGSPLSQESKPQTLLIGAA
jgi:hypothetical protein